MRTDSPSKFNDNFRTPLGQRYRRGFPEIRLQHYVWQHLIPEILQRKFRLAYQHKDEQESQVYE